MGASDTYSFIDRPLVSIVMIFLNEERFISEAIESILTQTYDSWEMLLIDDGSADKSSEIGRQYAHKYPGKIKYLEHTGHVNCGISASRNLGIQHATGSLIAFLDADDVWFQAKLEQQVALFRDWPLAGMICGATEYWYSWNGAPETSRADEIIRPGVPADMVYEPPHLLFALYPLGEGAAPSMNAVLIRKDVVDEVGGFETSFRGMYEDQVFLTKVYLNFPVFVARECWDRYRQHANSCVAVAINSGQYDHYRSAFLSWLKQYLKWSNNRDRRVWSLLQRKLRPYRYPRLHRLQEKLNALFAAHVAS